MDQTSEDGRWNKSLQTITIMAKEDDPSFSLFEQWESERPGDICKSKGAKSLAGGEQVEHLQELHECFLMSAAVDKPKSRQSNIKIQ